MRACCGLSCKRKREDAAKCGHHSGSVSGSRDPSLCRTKPVSIRLSHLCSFSLESERLVCGLSCLQCNNLQKPAGGVIDTCRAHCHYSGSVWWLLVTFITWSSENIFLWKMNKFSFFQWTLKPWSSPWLWCVESFSSPLPSVAAAAAAARSALQGNITSPR